MTEIIEKAGNNIKKVSYSFKKGYWTVTYRNCLDKDKVSDKNIIDFIENA